MSRVAIRGVYISDAKVSDQLNMPLKITTLITLLFAWVPLHYSRLEASGWVEGRVRGICILSAQLFNQLSADKFWFFFSLTFHKYVPFDTTGVSFWPQIIQFVKTQTPELENVG